MIANSVMSSALSRAATDLLPEPQRQSAAEGAALGAVITGVGLVTPVGIGQKEFYAALRSGRCALRRDAELGQLLPKKAAPDFPPFTARIADFGAAAAIDAGRRRRMPRLAQMCVVAAQEALGIGPAAAAAATRAVATAATATAAAAPAAGTSSGAAAALASALTRYGHERVAIVLGTGLGTLDLTMEFETGYIKGGLAAASPALFPYTVMNTQAAIVAMELQLLGGNITINHRDLSVHEAVATAVELLLCDRADAVLCGGCDELSGYLQHAAERLGGSARSDVPGAEELPPMRPYDRRRRGFAQGEGAVMLLLERPHDAARHGVRPLAAISGVGRAGDQRPRLGWPAAGDPAQTVGAAQAIRASLQAAGLTPQDLDFIVGSGNGTQLDGLETQALRQALGAAAERVPIASVLGQCGEWQTSAGVRLAAALYALHEQQLPGTLLCQEPDPHAALPGLILRPQPAAAPLRHVLVPALAQGGGNAALVLSRID